MNPSFFDLFQTINDIRLAASTDWGSLHPLAVHFPIVLLFVVPLFILAGLLSPHIRKTIYLITLVLLWAGVLSLLITFSTGETASEAIPKKSDAFQTLKIHYNLAELSHNIFFSLSCIFTLYFFLSSKIEKMIKQTGHNIILFLFLLAYLGGLLVLTSAAHQGGKLVHKYGIHSTLYGVPQ